MVGMSLASFWPFDINIVKPFTMLLFAMIRSIVMSFKVPVAEVAITTNQFHWILS